MSGGLLILEAALALVLLGIVVELGTRWWLRRQGAYYVWPPGLRLYLHLDRTVFPELEPLARIEINADGERGGAVPRSRDGLYRVLVGGGSPVECALLDQATSWPGALERLLQKPEHLWKLGASAVHVGNIGSSGVTSQALNLILERVLARYRQLDAIIIMVGGNDVFHWLGKGAPPSPEYPPLPASKVFSYHPEGPFGWRPGALAVIELLKRLRWRWLRPVKVRRGSGGWVAKARAMRARAREIRATTPDPTPMLDFFEAQLRQLLRGAKGRANRVLLVRQPWFEKNYTPEELAHIWHGGVGDPMQEEVTVYYTAEVLCRLMALVDARAAVVADELRVESLTLWPSLEPSLETYYDFVHFTPAGAAVVAEAVGAALLRSPTAVADRPLRVQAPAR